MRGEHKGAVGTMGHENEVKKSMLRENLFKEKAKCKPWSVFLLLNLGVCCSSLFDCVCAHMEGCTCVGVVYACLEAISLGSSAFYISPETRSLTNLELMALTRLTVQ